MSARDPSSPSRTYYEACVGRWRGQLEMVITDRERLRQARLSLGDRMRLAGLVMSARLFGPPRFDTTVTMLSPTTVLHTTRFGLLGVPSFCSREVIVLAPDGTSGAITITQRFFPLYWPAQVTGPFPVKITSDATRAVYDLVFLGIPMRQTGHRDGDRVTLVQETDWMRCEQRLVRQPR